MGVLITSEQAPAGSTYTNWKCYRATTKTGTFTVQNGANGQLLTDLTYFDTSGVSTHWYKISYYDTDNSVESSLSDPMQGFQTLYTTVRKVQSYLNLLTLTDSTTPTIQYVADLIARIEDIIDNQTGHAWRKRYSNTNTGSDNTSQYEMYDVPFGYEKWIGRPVYLKHRKIYTLDADEGDALEYYDGSQWVDWIADKTEGRSDDFWLDYDRGILYMRVRYMYTYQQKIRIKYRYGETTVNRIVEDLATKMVAKEILMGESKASFLPEGSISVTPTTKVNIWEKEIINTLTSLKEFQTMTIMS